MLMVWTLARVKIVAGAEPRLLRRFHLVIILAPALAVGWAVAHDLYDGIRNKPYEPWVVAQQLHAMGIPSGTDVRYIGTGLGAFLAHLAGLRIILHMPNTQ